MPKDNEEELAGKVRDHSELFKRPAKFKYDPQCAAVAAPGDGGDGGAGGAVAAGWEVGEGDPASSAGQTGWLVTPSPGKKEKTAHVNHCILEKDHERIFLRNAVPNFRSSNTLFITKKAYIIDY